MVAGVIASVVAGSREAAGGGALNAATCVEDIGSMELFGGLGLCAFSGGEDSVFVRGVRA